MLKIDDKRGFSSLTEDLNISSTKFENSKDTEAGVMYFMNLQRSELEPMKRFETKENPYYFG